MKVSLRWGIFSFVILSAFLWQEKSAVHEKKRLSAYNFIDLSDGRVHYELSGDAKDPVILLLSGLDSSLDIWDFTVPQLIRAHYRVLRYDPYGSGLSDSPEIDTDLPAYRRQLTELIATLKLKGPFRVVGHSTGAFLAADFEQRYPSLVKKMVIIGPKGLHKERSYLSQWLKAPVIGRWLSANFPEDKTDAAHNSIFHIIEKSTRWPQYESPAQVNHLLLSFFSN